MTASTVAGRERYTLSSLWIVDTAQIRQVWFVSVSDKLWKARGALTRMVKDIEIAKKVNQQIREACRILDESAGLVRRSALGDAREYVVAVGRVFEAISAELLDPLYKEHPQIAPTGWETSGRSV